MNVLMIGVDETSVGGMLTVVNNYKSNKCFCEKTNLQYIATVIRANRFTKIKTFISKIPQIITTIKKQKIDIVHVHMAERGSVYREGTVVLIARAMGCKTVIHMHGANIETWYDNRTALNQKLISWIFNQADRMIILGENWRPFMERVMCGHEDKIRVLHNAVQVENCNMANENAKNILFYGMLIQRKGIDDLLEAFNSLVREIPDDIYLTLYGDDHDADEKIQVKIAKYNTANRIRYQGWLTEENRSEVFRDSLINVLPSYNEGLPMTILESMGYGIPNISTNIAAIPEAIDNGMNGFVIQPGNVQELKDSMKKLVTDKDLWKKFSENAYNDAKNKFSIQAHISTLLKIYNQLLEID